VTLQELPQLRPPPPPSPLGTIGPGWPGDGTFAYPSWGPGRFFRAAYEPSPPPVTGRNAYRPDPLHQKILQNQGDARAEWLVVCARRLVPAVQGADVATTPAALRCLPARWQAPLARRGRLRMATISGLVNTVINKPIARAAHAARHALESIAPEATASRPSPPARKSKGWRRHVRKAKARHAPAGMGTKR
jgi:hypothetical protein